MLVIEGTTTSNLFLLSRMCLRKVVCQIVLFTFITARISLEFAVAKQLRHNNLHRLTLA